MGMGLIVGSGSWKGAGWREQWMVWLLWNREAEDVGSEGVTDGSQMGSQINTDGLRW